LLTKAFINPPSRLEGSIKPLVCTINVDIEDAFYVSWLQKMLFFVSWAQRCLGILILDGLTN
jgi:hypothetical protein